ncbi:DUF2848 family protein [Amycolatopsis sp. FDAARGOS 1241]|uniref:DUF2848 family protein n=1 Tax=Amycolatopsis sp. FDAARGOS 1241 TaxID=2778070 RepID=UPI0019517116|nr:DUF2848 family protein [Amycolatopsis sp. FDAARGOS 1241]QRP47083.1 DUF2848 family protein [Amycolatopsis sp. FDAARGOS 1241]
MSLFLTVADTGARLEIAPSRIVVAGYTAKDEAAVEHHIAELAAIGVPRPATVPAYYVLDADLLTTAPVIEVSSAATSGEVEPVVIRHDGRYYLGVGSDHTDRDLERTDIELSKAACPKPLGEQVVELSTVDWNDLAAESRVDEKLYQQGSVESLRHPTDTLSRMPGGVDDGGDLVLYCGTLALLGGEFGYGTRWRLDLRLPGGPTLSHVYETQLRRA